MDRWVNGWMGGWIGGEMERYKEIKRYCKMKKDGKIEG